jgi:tetratricopeptide (TPR) repeat protein
MASVMRRVIVALAASLSLACAAKTAPVAVAAETQGRLPAEASWAEGSVGAVPRDDQGTPVALRAVPSRTTLQTAEQWDAALASALTRMGESPSAADLLAVAAAYKRIGIGDKAIDYYAKALEMAPGSAAAYDGLARVWRDWGFPDVGLAEAYRAAYYAPASAEVQNTLGTLLQALGSNGPARERYERALALDPRAAYALANLCGLELMEGLPEKAVATCERALAIDDGLNVARRHLTVAEAMIGRRKPGDPNARH